MKRKACKMESECLWMRGPLIGKGSCGLVYIAISKNHNYLPTVMAVKSAEISASNSLQKEKRVLSNFEGCTSHIIECYGEDTTLSDDGQTIYNLLLEYASGGTLGDVLQKSGGCGLPEPEVKHYTRCILEGLSDVHEIGYVHCDLKPENILLVRSLNPYTPPDHEFVAKIGDFGMAKKRDAKASLRGSPMYISPEVVNLGIQEAASDVWAVGCIVLKMLTGKPPWNFKTEANETTAKLLDFLNTIGSEHESPTIPSTISEEAKDFLSCCFARIPAQRLTASELLNHKFLVASKEGSKKADEGDKVQDEEGVSLSVSPTYDDSFIPLGDFSSSSILEDTELVTSYSIIPNICNVSASKSVIPAGA